MDEAKEQFESNRNYNIANCKLNIINGFFKIKATDYILGSSTILQNSPTYILKKADLYINAKNQLATQYDAAEYCILNNEDEVIIVPSDITIEQINVAGNGAIYSEKDDQTIALGMLSFFNNWAIDENSDDDNDNEQ